jgi:cyclase
MRKFVVWTLVTLGVAIGVGAIYVYMQIRSLTVVTVTDDLHMIQGFGGNVGVLKTGAGTVIVDTMTFTLQGERIRRLAEELTGEPVTLVINTHYHSDHTHGNPGFVSGTRVISTKQTLHHLHALDASYWEGSAAALLPNETIEGTREVLIGNKTLKIVQPGAGHTDGDLVVLFVEDKTLHAGDLFFNHLYPSIDLEAGGSVQQWVPTLDVVLALPFEHVIPGHGALSDAAGLKQFREFMQQLAAVGANAKATGAPIEATLRDADITADVGYQPIVIPFFVRLDRDLAIRRACAESTGHVTRAD